MVIMMTKDEIELECLVCGHHIKSNSAQRIMCSECGNGIYAPVNTLVLKQ